MGPAPAGYRNKVKVSLETRVKTSTWVVDLRGRSCLPEEVTGSRNGTSARPSPAPGAARLRPGRMDLTDESWSARSAYPSVTGFVCTPPRRCRCPSKREDVAMIAPADLAQGPQRPAGDPRSASAQGRGLEFEIGESSTVKGVACDHLPRSIANSPAAQALMEIFGSETPGSDVPQVAKVEGRPAGLPGALQHNGVRPKPTMPPEKVSGFRHSRRSTPGVPPGTAGRHCASVRTASASWSSSRPTTPRPGSRARQRHPGRDHRLRRPLASPSSPKTPPAAELI